MKHETYDAALACLTEVATALGTTVTTNTYRPENHSADVYDGIKIVTAYVHICWPLYERGISGWFGHYDHGKVHVDPKCYIGLHKVRMSLNASKLIAKAKEFEAEITAYSERVQQAKNAEEARIQQVKELLGNRVTERVVIFCNAAYYRKPEGDLWDICFSIFFDPALKVTGIEFDQVVNLPVTVNGLVVHPRKHYLNDPECTLVEAFDWCMAQIKEKAE